MVKSDWAVRLEVGVYSTSAEEEEEEGEDIGGVFGYRVGGMGGRGVCGLWFWRSCVFEIGDLGRWENVSWDSFGVKG